jgi:hypothetical protein
VDHPTLQSEPRLKDRLAPESPHLRNFSRVWKPSWLPF